MSHRWCEIEKHGAPPCSDYGVRFVMNVWLCAQCADLWEQAEQDVDEAINQ